MGSSVGGRADTLESRLRAPVGPHLPGMGLQSEPRRATRRASSNWIQLRGLLRGRELRAGPLTHFPPREFPSMAVGPVGVPDRSL